MLKVIVTSRTINFTLLSPTHSILSSTRVSAGVSFAIGSRSLEDGFAWRQDPLLTRIADVELPCFEWFSIPVALPGGCTGIEEAREARTDLPHQHHIFVQRDGDQPPSIRRETASGQSLFVALEDVEARGGLEVEHDDRSFGRSHSETLSIHVEVDGWEAVKH